MAQEPTHPLLSFPDDEIIRNLGEMSLEEILKFSLVSVRCKNLVISVKIKTTSFQVSVSDNINVYIETGRKLLVLSFYNEQDRYWGMGVYGQKKKLTAPQTVGVDEYGPMFSDITRSNWENNTLTMQYWLKHLQDIFNYSKIDSIWFTSDSSQFDIDDIKEVFGTATQVMIGKTGCFNFNQLILQKLPVEKLNIKPANNFQNSEIPGKVLMQNFDYLEIDSDLERATSMTLNELLLTNSKKSYVGVLQISAKELNKFIRLWQKGSNPRMEYLGFDLTNAIEGDNEVIMKGISHQVVPADQKRRFKPAENGMPEVVEGGIHFFRKDGVKATILFRGPPYPAVEMLVWFDHCVMES